MIVNYFAAATLLLIVGISAYVYNHRGRRYAMGKSEQIDSPGGFAMVYRFIQLTTVVFGVGSFLFDHALLLEVHNHPALVIAGSVVALVGLAVFLAAKAALGRHYSPCFDSFVPSAVVREGVYRCVRHPIYTSNYLVVGGLALASGSLWLAFDLLLLVIYYNIAARKEENALADRFAEYRDHLRHTGRFFPLFPGVFSRPVPARAGSEVV